MLNYLHAFYGGGALLGPLIAAAVLTTGHPWNRVYLLWVFAGVALFLGFLRLFPARDMPPRESPSSVERNVLFSAVRLRVVQLGALFLVLYVGIEVTVGNWSYSFLTEVRHGNILHAGWITSVYWLGLTFGRLAVALAVTRFAFAQEKLIRYCLAGCLREYSFCGWYPERLRARWEYS